MQLRHFCLGAVSIVFSILTACAQPAPAAHNSATSRIDSTGTPRSLYNLAVPTSASTVQDAARSFLSTYAQSLRLQNTDDGLVVDDVIRAPAGTHVRFRQRHNGVPVYGADVVVSLNVRNAVTMVVNNAHADVEAPTRPSFSGPDAIRAALRQLNARGNAIGAEDAAELVVFRSGDGADHLAYRVTVTRELPPGDWEVILDAESGATLQISDRFVEHNDGDRAPGRGYVFAVDPLAAARQQYGSTGFIDNNDADSDSLTAYRSLVALDSVTFIGGAFRLQGPYCTIMDIESPFDSVYGAVTPDGFSYTRSQAGFEAVNAYYHASLSYRRFEELGFSSARLARIRIDPHGFQGQDNSHYSPTGNWIAFGTGGVDDAEDPDVIWHEYGHAIQYTLNPTWGGGECAALGEGYADYWAESYSRSAGRWTEADPQFNWVYKWDGHNEFWSGRKVNDQRTYPFGTLSAHTAGQIWSTALMGIWGTLGRDVTDRLVLQSICYLGANATAVDAAMALVQADRDLYNSRNLSTLVYWLGTVKHFIDPTLVYHEATDVEPATGVVPARFALGQNYPNPFNPTTTIRYAVGDNPQGSAGPGMQAGWVKISVYDLLGREVAVLVNEKKDPGSYDVRFDASGLASGLYIYRLQAAGMDEMRKMTLVR